MDRTMREMRIGGLRSMREFFHQTAGAGPDPPSAPKAACQGPIREPRTMTPKAAPFVTAPRASARAERKPPPAPGMTRDYTDPARKVSTQTWGSHETSEAGPGAS